MILVRRKEVPPEFVELVARFLPDAERFYAIPLSERSQKQFDFSFASRNSRQVLMPTLFDQFSGKCAYCESTLGAATKGHVDWFRPVTGVSGPSGRYLRDHYWRQAFEWENMYLACAECSRNKANRFPLLDENARAQASAVRSELAREAPLLLDPCLDDPSQHLLFSRDGAVAGTTEKGRVTIEVLGLNRPGLKADRQRILNHFEHATERYRLEMLRGEQPFAAAVRQAARRLAESPSSAEKETVEAAILTQRRFDQEKERASTSPEGNLDDWDSRKRVIESITIENVGTVASLQLDLLAKNTERTPCFALLGINGAGKSTILKAIALALGGRPYARRLKLKSNDLLADGAASGQVAICISGFEEEVVLSLVRDRRLKFRNENRAYVLAYGSSRLLATPKHRPRSGFAHAKVDNLFDPFLPVGDAEAWLASVPEDVFDDAAMTLRGLLPVDDSVRLSRPDGPGTHVLASVGGGNFRSFGQLSDGYQSLLGMAADIMEMMHGAGYQSMQSAQGVVLIDELGNHFHPAWRMQIVTALRSAFPKVQFIFSTHEPLCLRGLEKDEVAALRRDAHSRVYALTELPDVSQLRVDQLLASEHFGLQSTVDPELERAMRRYQALVVKPSRTEDEGRELKRLRSDLTGPAQLGLNRRERMLMELLVFDEANFPPPEIPSVSADVLSRNSVNRIKEIMAIVSGPHDTPGGATERQQHE